VYGLGSTVPTHSNAEYVAVDWRVLSRKPANASWEDAAALPLVGLTAWEMLVEQLEIKKDKGGLLVINGAL
jgi:NADPH:quinone reductase-like Zn-dependent oxidoreductase